jgi:hypothetical protein
MIRLGAVLAAVIASIVLWHECGEDIGIFCYRIAMGAFTTLRSRALVPVPVSSRYIARTRAACLNRSVTSSTPFTMLKD